MRSEERVYRQLQGFHCWMNPTKLVEERMMPAVTACKAADAGWSRVAEMFEMNTEYTQDTIKTIIVLRMYQIKMSTAQRLALSRLISDLFQEAHQDLVCPQRNIG